MTSPTEPQGATVTAVPEVLFVCVHNAGRSQMAAALLAHHAAGRVQVRSAGSIPAQEINPAVIAAMAEIGLDLSTERPKPLTDDAVQVADVVITMSCGDACPIYPGKRYLDWNLPDPAGKTLAEVRPIRDEIDHRVCALLEKLAPTVYRRQARRLGPAKSVRSSQVWCSQVRSDGRCVDGARSTAHTTAHLTCTYALRVMVNISRRSEWRRSVALTAGPCVSLA
jgi:arsenate reductase